VFVAVVEAVGFTTGAAAGWAAVAAAGAGAVFLAVSADAAGACAMSATAKVKAKTENKDDLRMEPPPLNAV
jgi:hypothetical protein